LEETVEPESSSSSDAEDDMDLFAVETDCCPALQLSLFVIIMELHQSLNQLWIAVELSD